MKTTQTDPAREDRINERTDTTNLVKDLPWHIAHERARLLPTPLDTEHLPLNQTTGRILAKSIQAQTALPNCNTSAMDGYAITGQPPWHIIGRILAGDTPWPTPLQPGTAIEIMTGAPVPTGTHAVIPYEHCQRHHNQITAPTNTHTHIRTTGEDAQPGEQLVPPGQPITPATLGTAAQAGLDTLTVYRRPRLHLLITGDEIIHTGTPKPGQVRDALGPTITALLQPTCTITQQHLPDNRNQLLNTIRNTTNADIIAISGGSSIGAADHLHHVLQTLNAHWHVDGIRCRPGHPQTLAQTNNHWIIGLPGNPFAGLVAALTLLTPLTTALSGQTHHPPLHLPITGNTRPHPNGVRLVPVRIDHQHAVVIPTTSPASLRAAATADALAVIQPEWTPGTPAQLLPLS